MPIEIEHLPIAGHVVFLFDSGFLKDLVEWFNSASGGELKHFRSSEKANFWRDSGRGTQESFGRVSAYGEEIHNDSGLRLVIVIDNSLESFEFESGPANPNLNVNGARRIGRIGADLRTNARSYRNSDQCGYEEVAELEHRCLNRTDILAKYSRFALV